MDAEILSAAKDDSQAQMTPAQKNAVFAEILRCAQDDSQDNKALYRTRTYAGGDPSLRSG